MDLSRQDRPTNNSKERFYKTIWRMAPKYLGCDDKIIKVRMKAISRGVRRAASFVTYRDNETRVARRAHQIATNKFYDAKTITFFQREL